MRCAFLSVLCLSVLVTACEEDDLNAVVSYPDPSVDDTPPDAPFQTGQRRDVADAHATYELSGVNDYVGGVVMPGDLDGDGFGDLVIWGTLQNDPEIVPCEDGCPGFEQVAVDVIYGGPHIAADAELVASAHLLSPHVRASLSGRVAAAGDVNGDGNADLLVSVVGNDCDAQGSVYLVLGGARLTGTLDVRDVGGLLREDGSCTGYGGSAGIGDVDDDGFTDFMVTAPDAMSAYLYYGGSAALPMRRSEADAEATFVDAPFRGARPAGDVNGDGVDDFLLYGSPSSELEHLGETHPENPPTYYLVLGGARRTGTLSVEGVATRIDATYLSALGDVDGDGFGDLGGTRTAAEGAPDGFLIGGRGSWPTTLDMSDAGAWIERGVHSDSGLTRFASAGDLDGDGHLDLIYADSAYASDTLAGSTGGPPPRGAVLLFAGPIEMAAGSLDPEDATVFLGRLDDAELMPGMLRGHDSIGSGIATGDDLDGDGIDDMVLAANHAPDGGRVYLWLGRD